MIWHMTYEYIWKMISHIIYDIIYIYNIISYQTWFLLFQQDRALFIKHIGFFRRAPTPKSAEPLGPTLQVAIDWAPRLDHREKQVHVGTWGNTPGKTWEKFLGISSGNGQKVRNQQDMTRVCHGLPENGDLPTSFWQF